MKPLRTIEIVGGGLAGLSLGLALRRRQVPVTLHDAGEYPRHRVCGEFIRGLRPDVMHTLELAPLLHGARDHRELTWFVGDAPLRRQRLPRPALALSRHELDARLAAAFVESGGELRLRSRIEAAPREGRVVAHGRRAEARSGWLGLKVHAQDLALDRGLEMHLGEDAYVGLCALPSGTVNVCGLFRQRRGVVAPGARLLCAYLHACGLHGLAERLDAAVVEQETFCAVAGLAFGEAASEDAPTIGDAFAMIPPFTGQGMAMAFESAAAALPPLVEWARGHGAWGDATRAVQVRLRRRFAWRLGLAGWCHPFLLQPRRQRWLAAASDVGALPVGALQRLLS